ncbi:DUF3619 family protein [Polynucleobacter sphagniphilus]|uniref:DUF3619 domain-containing protein n=1 Tax=Polynucleobacter sphagniphilus TaxID=1743169 RepID=A0AA43M9J6_9BURK|nr:DUF3619 family protein [Polynucleobacter sphagniphilus]MDH6155759.1 hypothetical protein [Polynucleobacter sphagniphilus]MDH6242222.1 hypothetical protein [Polynucleobacter sphagniphilus]MDH6249899.1 hypothetical protein [Polynucleobacter sphagniphilus]MDH6299473.1 hypothetical protein [Polynucleobacter sphagniphilus]MDH6302656.1 hypothetical protein [Polynucleobacter sphagniphilus]
MNRARDHLDPVAQDHFARASAALLRDGSTTLPSAINNRLHAARMKALSVRKPEKVHQHKEVLATITGNWSSHSRSGSKSIWETLGWVAPLVVLVFGLIGIAQWQDDSRINDMAQVDAALLTDDVPPDAYADSGFMAFLKNGAATADHLESATTR